MALVLVVDDSEDLQDAFQAILTDEGFEVAERAERRARAPALSASCILTPSFST